MFKLNWKTTVEYFDAKKLEMLNVKSEKLPHLWSKKKM